jgi:glycosyltransferase involved in cell wall biosynthesis
MATRFAPEKGVEEFVDACAAIARNHSGARFTLAGNGPLLEPARRRAHALGLTDRLSFPGFVRDMPTFWRSLDVAIFTTPKEPFGLRIIEPMTCGTPVVAYRTGFGSDELIEDRVTGHLIDTFGDAEAMAARCLDAVRDTKQWTAMSQAGRSKVRTEFSLERMARSINELYADVLRSAPPFEASNT